MRRMQDLVPVTALERRPRPRELAMTVSQERAALATRLSDALPLYVRASEVHAALERLDGRPRGRSMLQAAWEWGPRISELLAVQVADVNFGQRCAFLFTLKRRPKLGHLPPRRIMPCSGSMLGAIAMLVQLHGLGPEDRLWPYGRSWAHNLLQRALLAVGVEPERANARSLRHGFGVNCTEQQMPLNVLQRLMGHASATTTSVYIQVLGLDVAGFYDRVRW